MTEYERRLVEALCKVAESLVYGSRQAPDFGPLACAVDAVRKATKPCEVCGDAGELSGFQNGRETTRNCRVCEGARRNQLRSIDEVLESPERDEAVERLRSKASFFVREAIRGEATCLCTEDAEDLIKVLRGVRIMKPGPRVRLEEKDEVEVINDVR